MRGGQGGQNKATTGAAPEPPEADETHEQQAETERRSGLRTTSDTQTKPEAGRNARAQRTNTNRRTKKTGGHRLKTKHLVGAKRGDRQTNNYVCKPV